MLAKDIYTECFIYVKLYSTRDLSCHRYDDRVLGVALSISLLGLYDSLRHETLRVVDLVDAQPSGVF